METHPKEKNKALHRRTNMEEEIISAQIRWIYAEQKINAERRNNIVSFNKDPFSIIDIHAILLKKLLRRKHSLITRR
jgi:hypothetical protein